MFTVSPSYFCFIVRRPPNRWPQRVQRKSAREAFVFQVPAGEAAALLAALGAGKAQVAFLHQGAVNIADIGGLKGDPTVELSVAAVDIGGDGPLSYTLRKMAKVMRLSSSARWWSMPETSSPSSSAARERPTCSRRPRPMRSWANTCKSQ